MLSYKKHEERLKENGIKKMEGIDSVWRKIISKINMKHEKSIGEMEAIRLQYKGNDNKISELLALKCDR